MPAPSYVTAPEWGQVVTLLVPDLGAIGWGGTCSHVGISASTHVEIAPGLTGWPAAFQSVAVPVATEVQRLRDQIIQINRLTKQDIARAIGVDRRSLQGFVTGEIRPTDARLESLRSLARISAEVAARFGERTREVLRADGGEGCPLDLLALGRTDIDGAITAAARAAGVASQTPVSIKTRRHRAPLYLRAREVWAGRVDIPTPGGTARDLSEYEQDLSKAAPSVRPDRPRRKRI